MGTRGWWWTPLGSRLGNPRRTWSVTRPPAGRPAFLHRGWAGTSPVLRELSHACFDCGESALRVSEAGLAVSRGPRAALSRWRLGQRLLGTAGGQLHLSGQQPALAGREAGAGTHTHTHAHTHVRTHVWALPTSQGRALRTVGSEGSEGPTAAAAGVMRARLRARACRTGSGERRRQRRTVRGEDLASTQRRRSRRQTEPSQSQEDSRQE